MENKNKDTWFEVPSEIINLKFLIESHGNARGLWYNTMSRSVRHVCDTMTNVAYSATSLPSLLDPIDKWR